MSEEENLQKTNQAYHQQLLDSEAREEALDKKMLELRFEMGQTKIQLESVLFAMEDGVIATNPQGRVVVVNRVAQIIIYGLGADDPVGLPLDEVLPDPRLSEKLDQIEHSGNPGAIEMELSVPERHIYQASITPIRELDGNFVGMVMVLRDITKLRELERMKGAFLNTVSHELRTPMTSIRAFSELMSKKNPEPDKVKQWASIIYQEAERLGRLIDDLLDVSRLEAGKKLSILMADFEIRQLIEHTMTLFSNQQKKHPIHLDIEEGIHSMVGDVDRLHQVLSNLISNAIKYSPDGGEITLRVRRRGDEIIRIEVEDQGMGLSEKDRLYVFEKFYRVESKQGVEIGGTGLGLSICKYIAKAHGGQIGVRSVLGKGSTFWIEIPRIAQAEGASQ